MRSVRGRVEISASFIHLAFYSKLQPDVTGVSQCARVMVRMCAQVRWSSSWRERHWKSCGGMFYFIFAPFFWSQEKFIHPFPRCCKISTTALKSLPVRSCRAAAVSLLRARWGLLSYLPQKNNRVCSDTHFLHIHDVFWAPRHFFPITFVLKTNFKIAKCMGFG